MLLLLCYKLTHKGFIILIMYFLTTCFLRVLIFFLYGVELKTFSMSLSHCNHSAYFSIFTNLLLLRLLFISPFLPLLMCFSKCIESFSFRSYWSQSFTNASNNFSTTLSIRQIDLYNLSLCIFFVVF